MNYSEQQNPYDEYDGLRLAKAIMFFIALIVVFFVSIGFLYLIGIL